MGVEYRTTSEISMKTSACDQRGVGSCNGGTGNVRTAAACPVKMAAGHRNTVYQLLVSVDTLCKDLNTVS